MLIASLSHFTRLSAIHVSMQLYRISRITMQFRVHSNLLQFTRPNAIPMSMQFLCQCNSTVFHAFLTQFSCLCHVYGTTNASGACLTQPSTTSRKLSMNSVEQ